MSSLGAIELIFLDGLEGVFMASVGIWVGDFGFDA